MKKLHQYITVNFMLFLKYLKNFKKIKISGRLAVVFTIFMGIFLVIFLSGILLNGTNKNSKKAYSTTRQTSLNFILNDTMSNFSGCEKLDKKINRFMKLHEIKGASLAIMKEDKLLYAKGYGFADKNGTVPCTVKNIFRIASASKLITAIGIMKLQEDNKLSLNDCVFGPKGILNDTSLLHYKNKNIETITVEHLLRHRGGFRTPHGDPMFNTDLVARYLDKELPLKTSDYVKYATLIGLRWKPGSSSDYSNIGYLILSAVIEKVSGMRYEDYIQKEILRPLGICDMHIAENYPKDYRENEVYYFDNGHGDELVMGYDGSSNLVDKANGGNDVKALLGAGGWIASPVELLRLVASINNNPKKKDILSPKSIIEMTASNKNLIPLGWAKTTKNEWYRSGNMCGTSALIKKEQDGTTWIFITNTSSWRGPNFYRSISANIKKAINSVEEWPSNRDLFNIK